MRGLERRQGLAAILSTGPVDLSPIQDLIDELTDSPPKAIIGRDDYL